MWQKTAVRTASAALGVAVLAALTRPAWAMMSRSRTDGYEVQKTDAAWKAELSEMQYFVLRQGGTERPGYSILETEKRTGEFRCAGCGTPLFNAKDKFRSGTGWPSFARGLAGVEIDNVGMVASALSGAELRCRTCGGHLGDVFKDGFLFIGTEAAITGERYCIDGAALVFYPLDGSGPVRGDQRAPVKGPSFLEPPAINARPNE
jgi:peptide-methionine (R)-S-oxide reductase